MKFSGFNLIPLCIPVYASYPPLPVAHARLGYHCHAIGFVGRLHANSDRVQLAERTPAFLTPARADAPNLLVVQGDSETRASHRVFGCICPLCGPRWFFATIAALLLLAMESPFLVVAPCASRKALRDLPQQV
ncbi:MAG: DotU family type IV/VI secretion system protein [Rhodanobacteraceae bacterium]|nr:DotU family type IV/VI secretion system protein [Rhodanobacteraceae bacterium]